MPSTIDDKDEAILRLLEQDSRASTQAIADSLSLPRVTVHDRIRRLKDKGVIEKFTISRDARAVGLNLRSFILVKCERSNVDRRTVAEKMCEFPFVVRVSIVTGEWDLLVEVVASSMDGLGDVILDDISSISGIAGTQTLVAFYDFAGPASSFR